MKVNPVYDRVVKKIATELKIPTSVVRDIISDNHNYLATCILSGEDKISLKYIGTFQKKTKGYVEQKKQRRLQRRKEASEDSVQ